MSFFRSGDNAGKDPAGEDDAGSENAGKVKTEASTNASLESLRQTIKVGTDQYEYALIDGIVSFLEKLDAVIPAEKDGASLGDKRNHEIIAEALRIIHDAGSKMKIAQTAGFNKAIEVLQDFNAKKTTYVEDMKRLGCSFAEIQVTDATRNLWRDLAEWMQELHDHTANARKDFKKDKDGFVLPNGDGTYPHTCFPDKIFKTSTGGISKYSLIYNYGVAAKLLKNVIATYEAEHSPTLKM